MIFEHAMLKKKKYFVVISWSFLRIRLVLSDNLLWMWGLEFFVIKMGNGSRHVLSKFVSEIRWLSNLELRFENVTLVNT